VTATIHPLPAEHPTRTLGRITDLDAERAVIGAALISDRIVEPVATETGLAAHHFATKAHAEIWQAIIAIVDRGDGVDAPTVQHELDPARHAGNDGLAWLEAFVQDVPAVTNAKAYARRVVEAHRWEQRRLAHHAALAAIQDRDETALSAAEAIRDTPRGGDHTLTPQQVGEHITRVLDEPELEGLPTPWPRLGFLKLRPGATTTIAAWTSIGKSVVVDQILSHAARNGHPAHAWINEMDRTERALRELARLTDIPFADLEAKRVNDHWPTVLRAAEHFPFGITECHGWNAQEIARHIRRIRPAIGCVDLFNLIPGSSRTDSADEIVSTLVAAAHQADTHLLIVCQLNQERNKNQLRPAPVLRDIRQTGALYNNPNNVLLVHREDEDIRDPDGKPTGLAVTTDRGHLHVAKQRGGRLGTIKVRFDGTRFAFVEEFRL
jgi:replicative DNA helicase